MANTTDSSTGARSPRRWRPDVGHKILALVLLPVLLVELYLAKNTAGTYDILIWLSFADPVREVGPIDIYSLPLGEAGLMVYNHPPLVGWWLEVVNFIDSDVGVTLRLTMRAATSLAHVVTAFLVLAILRRRVGERWALYAAIAVALSPALAIISGYHGNNDPIVAMLTIAAVYLLVDRRWPVWAGVAFSLAISVKIVPIIVLPVLLVAAWGLGRTRDLGRFALGGLPVFLLFWVPVLLQAREGFVSNVLGYDGSGFPRQWGLYQLGTSAGVGEGLLDLFAGPGTYLVLALSAFLPAWFIRNQPHRAPAALGLSLVIFLVLTPGWAPQYNAYVAAAVFLVEFWSALAFTVGGGAVYITLYTHWTGKPFRPWEVLILYVPWLALVASAALGVRSLRHQASTVDIPRQARGSDAVVVAEEATP